MLKCSISTALLKRMQDELAKDGFEGYWHDKFITEKTFDEYIVSRAIEEGVRDTGWMHYLKEDKDRVEMRHLFTQDKFEPRVGNCTLAAITSMLVQLQSSDPNATYLRVRGIAKYFLYTEKTGTPPMFVSPIVKLSAHTKLKVIQSLGKDMLGRNSVNYMGTKQTLQTFFHDLRTRLGESQLPAIITIKNASYGRYKMHSMLIVGVREIAMPTKNDMMPLQFLVLHDGWNDEIIYLPVDELGIFHLLEFRPK